MSITAAVLNYLRYSGDQTSESIFAADPLEDSVCFQQPINLGSGNNTIAVPSIEGVTVHGVIIVPPDGNTEEPTLRGENQADTGILLSASQASIIQFGETLPSDINLEVAAEASGFRLFWF